MRMLQVALLLLSLFADVGLCHECLLGWEYFQGMCYGYGGAPVSWGNAQTICEAHGASLAEVLTPQENDYISAFAKNESDACVWLGASDIIHEGMWEWSTRPNTFKNYANWAPGEPSESGYGEDCLNMYKELNYTWNDSSCRHTCSFICAGLPRMLVPELTEISDKYDSPKSTIEGSSDANV